MDIPLCSSRATAFANTFSTINSSLCECPVISFPTTVHGVIEQTVRVYREGFGLVDVPVIVFSAV